jgi:hypothetical protein
MVAGLGIPPSTPLKVSRTWDLGLSDFERFEFKIGSNLEEKIETRRRGFYPSDLNPYNPRVSNRSGRLRGKCWGRGVSGIVGVYLPRG